jgi:hypothetical protein
MFRPREPSEAALPVIIVLSRADISLIPGKSEAVEFGILQSVRPEEAPLIAEDAEREIRLDANQDFLESDYLPATGRDTGC